MRSTCSRLIPPSGVLRRRAVAHPRLPHGSSSFQWLAAVEITSGSDRACVAPLTIAVRVVLPEWNSCGFETSHYLFVLCGGPPSSLLTNVTSPFRNQCVCVCAWAKVQEQNVSVAVSPSKCWV